MSITPTAVDDGPAPAAMAVHCSFLRHEPVAVNGRDPACRLRLDALTAERRRVARGAELIRQGDPLTALYEIHAGLFKTCVTDMNGRFQVTGFPMTGELLGLDGIGAGRHSVAAVALEDALVCVIPYDALDGMFEAFATLQHEFHRLMSREIVRAQALMLMLGSVAAEARIATFLLDLIGRLCARGFSSSALVLRMTRDEIGSCLGLQLETVSRTFSKLQGDGVLEIRNRCIHVLDEAALRRIARRPGCGAGERPARRRASAPRVASTGPVDRPRDGP